MSQSLALFLSIGIELIVAAGLVAALRWGSVARTAVAAAVATIMTHWLAWWAMIHLMNVLGYDTSFVIVETVVAVVESVVYAVIVPLRIKRALAVSLIANGASAGLGLMIEALDLVA